MTSMADTALNVAEPKPTTINPTVNHRPVSVSGNTSPKPTVNRVMATMYTASATVGAPSTR